METRKATSNIIRLADAGYREKIYAWSVLVQEGRGEEFLQFLTWASFNTHRDLILFGHLVWKVRREGSDSKAILLKAGITEQQIRDTLEPKDKE